VLVTHLSILVDQLIINVAYLRGARTLAGYGRLRVRSPAATLRDLLASAPGSFSPTAALVFDGGMSRQLEWSVQVVFARAAVR